MSDNISIQCKIVLSESTQKKLKEYLSRTGLTQAEVLSKLIEESLDQKLDTSFDGWYSYLIKEEGMEPGEDAENKAYRNMIDNRIVPEVKHSNNTGIKPGDYF